jgi:uroporphyrinogen decarboxylase
MRTLDYTENTDNRIAITIGSRPGIEYAGLSDREIMENVHKKVQAVSAFVSRHDPDIIFSIAGPMGEAQTLGARVSLPEFGSPVATFRPLENNDDLEQLTVDAAPCSFMLCGTLVESIGVLAKMYPDKPVTATVIGPVTVAGQLMGVEKMLMKSVEARNFLEEVLDIVTERVIAILELQIEAGARHLHVADPISSLLSPVSFSALSLPFLEQVFKSVRVPNHLHICGNTNNHLPYLAKTAAHAVSVDTEVDMKKAAQIFGPEIAVCGQLASAGVLLRGTPEEVTDATKTMLQEMALYRNYIPATSCGMPRATPRENIQAFYNTVRGF